MQFGIGTVGLTVKSPTEQEYSIDMSGGGVCSSPTSSDSDGADGNEMDEDDVGQMIPTYIGYVGVERDQDIESNCAQPMK